MDALDDHTVDTSEGGAWNEAKQIELQSKMIIKTYDW